MFIVKMISNLDVLMPQHNTLLQVNVCHSNQSVNNKAEIIVSSEIQKKT